MNGPYASDARPHTKIETDVLVVGGGAAGLAAACTAAGHGVHVILVERYGFCGGAAVAGLSGTICGLYMARPGAIGRPEKVVFGFVDRFIEAMNRRQGLWSAILFWVNVMQCLKL